MTRATLTLSIERDLLVILMHRATIVGQRMDEQVEEILYDWLRSELESAGPEELKEKWEQTSRRMDDIYGSLHHYWEGQLTRAEEELPMPF